MMVPLKVSRSTIAAHSLGPVKGFVHREKDSLLAIAMKFFPSLSVGPGTTVGAAAVKFHLSEFVDAEQVDAAVAGCDLGEHLLISGFNQLVHDGCGQGVFDPEALLRGRSTHPISRWDLPVPESIGRCQLPRIAQIIASWATPRLFPRLRFCWRFLWPGGLGAGIAPLSRSLEDNGWAAWERLSRTKPLSASKSPTEATTLHRFFLPSGRWSAGTLPFRQSRPLMGAAASSLCSKPPARQRSQRFLSSLTGTNGKPGTLR